MEDIIQQALAGFEKVLAEDHLLKLKRTSDLGLYITGRREGPMYWQQRPSRSKDETRRECELSGRGRVFTYISMNIRSYRKVQEGEEVRLRDVSCRYKLNITLRLRQD